MKKPDLRERGTGFFGELDCLKYSLPTCFSQLYFAVLSSLNPIFPGLLDVVRGVAMCLHPLIQRSRSPASPTRTV